ncbi:MAG TPA: undecaprenyl-diphosphate phosphatase [Planctomycetota bacterium]|nr:undecaprenyl-diphosphate phosphatase [Planctomycetota bacterium]
MSAARALVLGILQGLGEFLPISSSGHLIVVPWLLGWGDSGLAFDVALHLGTLVAVAFAFWRDWLRLLQGGARGLLSGRPLANPDARLLLYLAIATVPGAVAGVLLDEWAETVFRSPGLVALMMALMGAVLWAADRRAGAQSTAESVSFRDALLIGLSQALAIVPGTSRSGATISAALLLGHGREAAARFSFLLALPITAGAALVKVPALVRSGADMGPVMIGMAAAAVSGLLAIRVLLGYVRTRTYVPFSIYRFAFAALVWLVLLLR